MPKVSVIVPVFNCEAYVEDCVRSITTQSEANLEIVLVNDGSTDGTLTILKKLASADRRIVIHSRPHSGYAGVARNLGLSHATGRYVAFLDGDDLYHPSRIKNAVAVFEAFPDVAVVFHDYKYFRTRADEDETTSNLEQNRFLSRAAGYFSEIEGTTYICRKDFYVFASIQCIPFHTSSIMLRRELVASGAAQFREDIYPGEDSDLWFRLVKNRRVAFVNQVLSYYRQRPGSITRDRERLLRTSIQAHSENLERGMDVFTDQEVRSYRSRIAQQLFGLGYECFCKGNVRDSRSAYRRSMGIEFRAGTLVAYLKTFAPQAIVETYRNSIGERTGV